MRKYLLIARIGCGLAIAGLIGVVIFANPYWLILQAAGTVLGAVSFFGALWKYKKGQLE